MQKLIAVYTTKGPRGVVCSGWSWVRGEKDAVQRCKRLLSNGEVLQSVWVSEWQKEPSDYRLVFGTITTPPLDMAANLRSSSKRKVPSVRKANKEKKVPPTKVAAEEMPAFVLITAIAAA